MKKLVYGLMAGILVFGLGGVTAAGELGPKVVLDNCYVEIVKEAKIVIVGTGFKPGQEVRVLFISEDGVEADIGPSSLEPQPKANKIGAWVTTWNCSRFVGADLIKEGAYAITVTDTDYNILAHTPLAFYKAEDKKKKK